MTRFFFFILLPNFYVTLIFMLYDTKLISLVGLYILLNKIVPIKFVNYVITFQKNLLFFNECIVLKMWCVYIQLLKSSRQDEENLNLSTVG